MEFPFQSFEQKWKQAWEENGTYAVPTSSDKPKFYVLDMFPYPSGAGLHVGHPLGYIASDIVSRFKRLTGHNVLHPIGFDAFGLPAEQYAIETGQHPATTTEENITKYTSQLKNIGFDYDWTREIRTSNPSYFKFTQKIFLDLFSSYYSTAEDKAKPISELEAQFSTQGCVLEGVFGDYQGKFTAEEWKNFSLSEKEEVLQHFRLAYLSYSEVNWCEALGTVLANDEVKEGKSERGGHPVKKVKMRQWFLRITAYAERLLEGLNHIDWSDSIKEQQRNWIGRSEGASVIFPIQNIKETIEVFTTRPDTIYGATFMVLAPEHPLVGEITTEEQKQTIQDYQEYVAAKSDIDRQAEKEVSGAFTGGYATHPITKEQLPIYIAEYVLMGYGTGAIMAVPSDDDRDKAFAEKFGIEIIQVVDKSHLPEDKREGKFGKMMNSAFLDGLEVEKAIPGMIAYLESRGHGTKRINFRLRDAGFSRQRYWGEPFPIKYQEDTPVGLSESELPVELPEVDSYLPTGDGKAPLAAKTDWVNLPDGSTRETDTMPGYAGSSWYFIRYMDPQNPEQIASPEQIAYWQDIDLYLGGSEHAVGHLLYSRFWHKFLKDKGIVPTEEPFKKLVNQGMIQGKSCIVYRSEDNPNLFISKGLVGDRKVQEIRINIQLAENSELKLEDFKAWRQDFSDAEFELEDGKYICGSEVEKMSKRWHNVVNPDDVIAEYGADTFRMYEMFLGPIEMHKPWDTKGIDGVFKFLKKVWRACVNEAGEWMLTDETEPTADNLKTLHKTIQKVSDDIEKLSFNTSISAFMIAMNEFGSQKCKSNKVMVQFIQLMAPFAPFITEELWQLAGQTGSIHQSEFPKFNPEFVKESSKLYPISVNGKVRAKLEFPADANPKDIESSALENEAVKKHIEGKEVKKVIVVPGKIVNVVVK